MTTSARAQQVSSIVGWGALLFGVVYIAGKWVASGFQVLPIPRPAVSISGGKVIISLRIPIENKSLIPVPITRFEGTILYRNYIPLANVAVDNPVTLQAGATTEMPVRVSIGLGTLADAGITIATDKAWFPSFYLKGKAYSGKLAIPVKQNIQII